jgi:hypothetical protein
MEGDMIKVLSVLFAVIAAVWISIGTASNASAETTYVYKTVHPVSHVTRYHNIYRTRYAYHVHRVVHVTRIKPIIYVHDVARIHIHTVSVVRHINVWETERLPAERIVTHSVIHVWD